jgi:RNA exonuclease 1
MGQSSPLHQQDLPAFNLISPRPSSQDADPRRDGEEWQTIENGRPTKKKKIPKPDSGNYPEFAFSKDSRLQAQIKISDLQNVVLYILADGTAPQFISVRHRNQFRKVVVLMVPGLEESMFESTLEDAINNTDGSSKKEKDRGHGRNGHQGSHDKYSSPDYYYPRPLKSERLPESVKPFADMFEHLWPVKAPGKERCYDSKSTSQRTSKIFLS